MLRMWSKCLFELFSSLDFTFVIEDHCTIVSQISSPALLQFAVLETQP